MKQISPLLLILSTLLPYLATMSCSTIHMERLSMNPQPSPARIEWDSATLCLVQPGGNSGRMIRLSNEEILCAFDWDHKMWVRHSSDEGRTWRDPIEVAATPGATLTNAELLQLRDGTVLCLYNERPNRAAFEPKDRAPVPENGQAAKPFSIWVARSASAGLGWQTPLMLFAAGCDSENGCWEPAAIELPSGEVQVYFANENPYPNSHEQEISLLRSHDGARTWGAPEKIIFRKNHRDGMPSPLVLRNKRGIAVAIEDNGWSGGNFKPVIAFTKVRDSWQSGEIEGASENRWSALADPLPPKTYAGAPCLRQMPSGETILSFQQNDKGGPPDSHMVVCIGDSHAREFGAASCSFPKTDGIGQLWNSVFVKDKQTVTAVSSTVINGVHGVWAIDGRLVR